MIQKGMLYVEAEAHLNDDGTEILCEEPFKLLEPHVCQSKPDRRKEKEKRERDKRKIEKKKDAKRLKRDHDEKMESAKIDRIDHDGDSTSDTKGGGSSTIIGESSGASVVTNNDRNTSKNTVAESMDLEAESTQIEGVLADVKTANDSETKREDETTTVDKRVESSVALTTAPKSTEIQRVETDKSKPIGANDSGNMKVNDFDDLAQFNNTTDEKFSSIKSGAGASTVDNVMDMDTSPTKENGIVTDIKSVNNIDGKNSITIHPKDVMVLSGHTNEVFTCAWNPTYDLLATGSGDTTARIWEMPSDRRMPPEGIVLQHAINDDTTSENGKVTSVEWNVDGSRLGTVSFTGEARIWNKDGRLEFVLKGHDKPVFALKWNRRGDSLLTGGVDSTAIVWNAQTGKIRQQFKFHEDAILDLNWRNNTSFASCSADSNIYVCKLTETQPLMMFQGHTRDINSIKWDPSGTLLASCSDDCTAKIWSMKKDSPLTSLEGHEREIFTLNWAPHLQNGSLLATAAYDATIRLWDVHRNTCLHVFKDHTAPVYSMCFSPDGKFLASGSLDHRLLVWDVQEGKVIKSYQGKSGIFEVSWSSKDDQIAACFGDSSVAVLDFKM
eukprot:CFRG5900T1